MGNVKTAFRLTDIADHSEWTKWKHTEICLRSMLVFALWFVSIGGVTYACRKRWTLISLVAWEAVLAGLLIWSWGMRPIKYPLIYEVECKTDVAGHQTERREELLVDTLEKDYQFSLVSLRWIKPYSVSKFRRWAQAETSARALFVCFLWVLLVRIQISHYRREKATVIGDSA